jgi:myosin-5
VLYSTEGFVDSNRDLLQPAIVDLMSASSSPFVKELFTAFEDSPSHLPHTRTVVAHPQPTRWGGIGNAQRAARGAPSGRSTIIFESVTTQFRNQLGALVAAITQTSPHFVRCINPNNQRCPETFDTLSCLEQLRCGGVMDAVHVTRSGFGSRYLYADFISRFHCCAPKAARDADGRGAEQEIAATIISAMGVSADLFRLGTTKLFLRHHVIEMLEVRPSQLRRDLSLSVSVSLCVFIHTYI